MKKYQVLLHENVKLFDHVSYEDIRMLLLSFHALAITVVIQRRFPIAITRMSAIGSHIILSGCSFNVNTQSANGLV